MTNKRKPVDHSKVPMLQGLSAEEREIALDNIRNYLEVVASIYDRISQDPEAYAQYLALTEERRQRRLKGTASSPEEPT